MALVDRARAIVAQPSQTWPVIAAEPATASGLFQGYVIPLALIAPVCTLISTVAFSHRSVFLGAVVALVTFVFELIDVALIAFIVNALAPSFGARQDPVQALKLVAYSSTPRWIAGVATLIPVLGPLLVLAASLYTLYVLYLGIPPVMGVPPDRAIGYTVVIVIAVIVLFVAIGIAVGAIFAALVAGAIVGGGLMR